MLMRVSVDLGNGRSGEEWIDPADVVRVTPGQYGRAATVRLRSGGIVEAWVSGEEIAKACAPVPTNVLVRGNDAAFWHDSYSRLRDTVLRELDPFVRPDDVSEEVIVGEAVERAAARLEEYRALVEAMAGTDGWSAGSAQRWAKAIVDEEDPTAFALEGMTCPTCIDALVRAGSMEARP